MSSLDKPQSRHSFERLKYDLLVTIRLGLFLAATLSILSLLPYKIFLLDLISHFQLQYFWLLSLGLLFCWRITPFLQRLFFLFGLLANLWLLIQLYLPPSIACTDCQYSEKAIHLMIANVRTRNDLYQRFVDAVPPETEVLGLLEIDSQWIAGLEPLLDRFPYRYEHPRPDNFGLALFSKYPLAEASLLNTEEIKNSGLPPTLSVKVLTPSSAINLILTHPVPPQNDEFFAIRNKQLDIVSRFIAEQDGASILLGDLNTSPWSTSFKSFLSQSGLRDARQGFGLLPTWPNHVPPLFIPIDYCLLDQSFSVVEIATIEISGSDHRGLSIKIAPRQTKVIPTSEASDG
jgi:endonuclease/exonuclease/phosphatase (EEP) superfamily protein YafD